VTLREELKRMKKMAIEREDWKACKALRNKIFEYDKAHPEEPSLALEVAELQQHNWDEAKAEEAIKRFKEVMKKEQTSGF
jgi:DNA-binding SARP family transcriptional activator